MRVLPLILVSLVLCLVGCTTEEDPTKRPDFVDTSDPSTVLDTMKPPPGKGADPTKLGPGPGAGTGPGPGAPGAGS